MNATYMNWRSTLVMEYAGGGTLYQYVVQNRPISVHTVASMFLDILDAVAECHRNNFVHGDIKPENILLTSQLEVKLADFGLSQPLRAPMSCLSGSFSALAPEKLKTVLRRDSSFRKLLPNEVNREESLEDSFNSVDEESAERFDYEEFDQGRTLEAMHIDRSREDVWSLACTLYFMVTGTRPFGVPSSPDMLWEIIKEKLESDMEDFFNAVPDEFQPVLRGIFKINPAERSSLEEMTAQIRILKV